MKGLLVLTGLLLIGSAIVKLRAAQRTGIGISIWAPLEILAGVALPAVAFGRTPDAGTGFIYVIMALSLLMVSTVSLWLRLHREQRRREEISGARLLTYVKYLSNEPETGDGDPETPGVPDPPAP